MSVHISHKSLCTRVHVYDRVHREAIIQWQKKNKMKKSARHIVYLGCGRRYRYMSLEGVQTYDPKVFI